MGKELHTFDWAIHSCSGKVQAHDMKDALHKVINIYFTFPYPSYDFARLDIKCKKRE